ncbi:hypothetical protein BgiMline_013386 [Biomphalaria glabrata]
MNLKNRPGEIHGVKKEVTENDSKKRESQINSRHFFAASSPSPNFAIYRQKSECDYVILIELCPLSSQAPSSPSLSRRPVTSICRHRTVKTPSVNPAWDFISQGNFLP